MSASQGYICLACGCVLSSMNTDWMHGVRDEHTVEVRNMFLKAQGEDPENKLARLNHQKAHIVHNSAQKQYRAVIKTEDKEDKELCIVTAQNYDSVEEKYKGRYRLPSKLDKLDIKQMYNQTDLFCTGCNAIPTAKSMIHDRVELLRNDFLVKFKGRGARFVALLIVQITVTMDQRRSNIADNVVSRHPFNAAAVIAYYVSVTMYCMFVGGQLGWTNGQFQLWHSYFFSEMPLHDKHCDTLLQALNKNVEYEGAMRENMIWIANHDDPFFLPTLAEITAPGSPAKSEAFKNTFATFCKTAVNIARLYQEHRENIEHFLHGTIAPGVTVWSLSQEKALMLDQDMRMSSLERFFNRKGSNAWSTLLMRFIIMAKEARADYTNESELGGQLLARIAPLAVELYNIYAHARALRRRGP